MPLKQVIEVKYFARSLVKYNPWKQKCTEAYGTYIKELMKLGN